MTNEQDDLGPLMRAVHKLVLDYSTPEEELEAAVRRKAEQYGAWQRKLGYRVACVSAFRDGCPECDQQVEAARAAYFEGEQP